ncbi:MAG: LPP20 family lipoprotein [Gallionellaceae bacterium]|jgi:hypothetical protein
MNHILRIAGILLAFSGMLFSAHAMGASPAWVTGETAEYPPNQYLLGRGIGATEEEAKNRARGELAANFEVRIEVLSENSTQLEQSGKHERVSRSASQKVSAKTDKVINGISLPEIWRNPVTLDYHALAVLPRAQASASMREELDKLDTALQQYLQAANSQQDPLLKIGLLSQALQSSIQREGFQSLLKVLDPSGQGVPAPLTQAEVRMQVDENIKKIRIAPEVSGEANAHEFFNALKGGLAAAGFLATNTDTADLLLKGNFVVHDLRLQGNWNWLRVTLEVSLLERATGRVRGSKTWSVKASAQDANTAHSRAIMEVEKLLKQELRTTIIGFAAN